MSFAEEFIEKLKDIADDLGLDDETTESFVNSGMERKGFKKSFTWTDPDPEDGGSGGGDFFSSKRADRQTRQVGQQRQGGNGGNSSFYGN